MSRSAARGTSTAAAALIGCLIALSVSSAAAAEGPGLWYFDAYHIQDAHDAGFTGKGVTIAVIDTQINLEVPTLQGADITVFDNTCFDQAGEPIPTVTTDIAADHGTNVVSLLVGSGAGYSGQTGVKGIAPDAKILYFADGKAAADNSVVCEPDPDNKSGGIGPTSMADAIYEAIDAGADIISVSQGGTGGDFRDDALAEALSKGIVFIGGVHNDETNMTDQLFPNASNGVVGVQSMGSDGAIQGSDTRLFGDPDTDVVGPGVDILHQGTTVWEEQRLASGTSFATPVVAGFLALVAQKYPNATGNQLIQTLIRNTGTEDHELLYDGSGYFGYGTASATHMLKVDPTQYDDVNPLIDPNNPFPSVEDIADPPARYGGAEVPAATPEPTEPGDPGANPVDGLLPVLLIGIGILLVIAVVATVIIVIAVRRSRTRTGPPSSS